MASNTLESDILLNKTNLLIAQHQRLVASWLPLKRKAEELQHARSKEEIESEEQEMFRTPMPELFGIGAKLPKDAEVRREELSSNEKLRKQLLGKDYAKKQKNRTKYAESHGSGSLQVGSKPKPRSITPKRAVDDDSEEDGGRSSLGKSVRRIHTRPVLETAGDAKVEINQTDGHSSEAEPQPLERPSNYLDEVLAERSLKKRRKSKKSKKPQEMAAVSGKAS